MTLCSLAEQNCLEPHRDGPDWAGQNTGTENTQQSFPELQICPGFVSISEAQLLHARAVTLILTA